MQSDSAPKRKRGADSGSGESDSESLLDEVDSNSPAQNVEEKPKSETPVAPPLLPIAELSRQDDTDIKINPVDPSAIFPSVSSPGAKDNTLAEKSPIDVAVGDDNSDSKNSIAESKEKEYPGRVDNVPLALSKPFTDYDSSSNSAIKNEGIFDSPSPDKDEILPPVLTSEESYVPKDEMPTLQASTNLLDSMATTSSYSNEMNLKYPEYVSQMEVPVETIKMEPGLQSSDENSVSETVPKPNMPESSAPRPESPTSFRRQPTASPPPPIPYSHIPPDSPRQSMDQNPDKSLSSQSVMLPTYIYNENERGDKALNPGGVPPGSLNLSQHHSAYNPYYHFPPHPHAEKMEPSPYLGMEIILR